MFWCTHDFKKKQQWRPLCTCEEQRTAQHSLHPFTTASPLPCSRPLSQGGMDSCSVLLFLGDDAGVRASILKSEVINVSDLLALVKKAGISCSRAKLEGILDRLSILRSRNRHGSNRGGRETVVSNSSPAARAHCVYILVESNATDLVGARASYVGYTGNPHHRLRQHNREIKGGARKTGFKGRQWKIAAVVYGFSNKKIALQFEYALQRPEKSAMYNGVKAMKAKSAKARLHNLVVLLTAKPFRRCGLGVQAYEAWIADGLREVQKSGTPLPSQIGIVLGMLPESKLACGDAHCCCSPAISDGTASSDYEKVLGAGARKGHGCGFCEQAVAIGDGVKCFVACAGKEQGCSFEAHRDCMADYMLGVETADGPKRGVVQKEMVPIVAPCPSCSRLLHWSSLIKH